MAAKGKKRIFAAIALALLALVIAAGVLWALKPWRTGEESADQLTVHFIDVGQGESALMMCGGETLMIDGGGSAASQIVFSYLQKTLGLKRIDYMISTHPHADHVGGLAAALNACTVGTVYSPVDHVDEENRPFESLVKYAALQNKALTIPKVGDSFSLGGAEVTFLGPIQASPNMNDMSLVVRITYGETSFLFTGDAETAEEADLIASGVDLKSDVLKVGHHGSASSTGEAFLNAVSPAIALIGLGENNSYGHPSADVIARLEDRGVKIYRTDLHGDIILTSDGKSVSVTTEKIPKGPVTPVPAASPTPLPSPSSSPEARPTVRPNAPILTGAVYIGNSSSKKFHYPDCSSVADMAEKNKVPLYSREEAIAQGYAPCGRCRP